MAQTNFQVRILASAKVTRSSDNNGLLETRPVVTFDQRRPQVSFDGIVIRIGSVEADVVISVEAPRLVVENVRR